MNRLLSEIVRYQKKASARKEDGVFLIEGPKMFREAPMDRMKTAVFSESGAKAYAELLSEARSYERVDGSRIFVSVVKGFQFLNLRVNLNLQARRRFIFARLQCGN